MAKLEFNGKTTTDQKEINSLMREFGILYESWGLKEGSVATDEDVLKTYSNEVERLMSEKGYMAKDVVCLNPDTPNLDMIGKKFVEEHFHTDDEVRFVVSGEGVFEIASENSKPKASDPKSWLKFTSEPGDLIVIPENRWHLFYLTDKKSIRCIRLFKDKSGWEAHYRN